MRLKFLFSQKRRSCYVWFSDCPFVRRPHEHPGCLKYRSDPPDRHLLSAGWVQLTAFFTCLILWLFSERTPVSSLLSVRPWYMAVGGILGALITWTVIRSMDGLGPAKATLFIVVTQIIIAYTIELFGWFGVEKAPFEWRKVLGALIAIGGIVLFHS